MTRIEGPKAILAEKWPHVLETLDEGRAYVLMVKRWYKPRTTGDNSQNHHIFGHATQIGAFMGMTKMEVIAEAQERALVKGYPTKINAFGRVVPVPEKELDTRGASILIEELHDMAAFLPLRLKEGYPEDVADYV